MMCVSLFSYQGSLPFSSDSFDSLSCSKPFVKNFFVYFSTFLKFFRCFSFEPQLLHFITFISICQELFRFFSNSFLWYSERIKRFLPNGEGGIWTLAPRKRPTPLAGAPLQPLEYFSKFIYFWTYRLTAHLLLYSRGICLSIIFLLFLKLF